MIFILGPTSKLKINDEVIERFRVYRQLESTATEAGGVLMGRFIEDSDDIIIDLITEPTEKDIRKRCFFKKHLETHQDLVDEIWEESDGTFNYLGEWHTHPEKHPSPSFHDRREWKKVLRKTQCESSLLFFFIIGTESIGAWVGNRRNVKINKLEVWNK
ncbi:Mov34/MPN/PAD-1 family protein [Evansella clarkii]|uniref:Mov34/MPN/PAD-1 family protein n=1 Tax=Evansella clarkii TaxID=79879 RepID=UPI0023EA5A3F|nr:Mov34/MPN/PAD-1 family protein [Evansella clarkii]